MSAPPRVIYLSSNEMEFIASKNAINEGDTALVPKFDYDALQAKLTEAKRLNAELTILTEFKGKPPSEIKRQWARMLAETTNDTSIKELIRWLNDDDRKEAILSFTEGSARHVAYAAEAAMKRDRETCPYMPLTIEQARITNLTDDLDSRNAEVAQLQAKLTESQRLNAVAKGFIVVSKDLLAEAIACNTDASLADARHIINSVLKVSDDEIFREALKELEQ